MKKLRVAIQMDPPGKLSKRFDSTLYLARAAARRGYELFHYEPRHLRVETDGGKRRITAQGHALKFKSAAQDSVYHGAAQTQDLSGSDVVLMRQDPPFDLAYFAATHILELLPVKVRVINDPKGVRDAPEKLIALHAPQLLPPTLVTRDVAAIEKFRARHGEIIFKPLFGFAGHGIFRFGPDDGNLHALLEQMAALNGEPWMIQKFLPAIAHTGDKRIILLDGEPAGCFTRMPARKDGRGNMRVGAKPSRAPLTRRDREICEVLAPILKSRGLYLAGIDVIGDYLTEVNVTSPTGLVVADRLAGRTGKATIAERFWEGVLAE
ncbi:MAG TPA: glutathione synthase [Alphaproteobacteria bacterium]|nr:glutathione synthase [Alphaproteobacteria bacterium]